MSQCLYRYQWVKLPRSTHPEGKGVLGLWIRLAGRAAFRKGVARYCGHINEVSPGMWSGGIVGLKSILGIKNRQQALSQMDTLQKLGYIEYSLDSKTKKLTYLIRHWVMECSGEECTDGIVYATEGYGFLCVPRNITEPLAQKGVVFGEADAWMDLWCHTSYRDRDNIFSNFAPVIQYGRIGAAVTLDQLGKRWGWEKTKVWRFFKKYAHQFPLIKLPGAFGSLIFNAEYPTDSEFVLPEPSKIMRICDEIRITCRNTHYQGNDHERFCLSVLCASRKLLGKLDLHPLPESQDEGRVALYPSLTRAYFSQACKGCNNSFHSCYDCHRFSFLRAEKTEKKPTIRGPCKKA